jgi:hypothetical protein
VQRILAIVGLTWKAAFRFRLFLVIAVLLLGSVVGLPLLIKDDGTARGCAQILLTYTLSVITVLLGLSTLWLACGTLARDIEECQIQVLAVKPVPRWQIWLGKWLGIVSLDAVMLALAGASVYGLLMWRASRLPPSEQATLRKEVLVARGSIKPESFDKQIEAEADRELEARLKESPVGNVDLQEVRKDILEQVKAQYQVVPPNGLRPWQIHLGLLAPFLRDQPLRLRIKFNAADRSARGTYVGLWQVGVPRETPIWQSDPMSLAPNTFHEFDIPPNLFDKNGVLTIAFFNVNNTSLLFPLDDGMEVLYREGGFGLNFARGLGIIFCWMSLLAALGLTAASFLSFPVAAFFSLGILTVALSSGTLANVVSEGSLLGPTPSAEVVSPGRKVVDAVVVPCFAAVLKVVRLAENFSPIDSLSGGRSISWLELGLAFGQIVLLLGGVIGGIGALIFSRRELATANQ